MRTFAFLAGLLIASTRARGSPPVTAQFTANWNAPPFILQILETVALEDPQNFFDFVTSIIKNPALLNASTSPADVYKQALQVINDSPALKQPGALASFKIALANKEASPAVQAQYQSYETVWKPTNSLQCDSWIDYDNRAFCHTADLGNVIDSATSQNTTIYAFDHIYPASSPVSTPPIVLYADILAPDFPAKHVYLLNLAKTSHSRLKYVLRWKSANHGSNKLPVSGYGAGLEIKKSDYLAIDDRGTESSKAQKVDTSEETVLRPLQARHLKDLGVKAVQHVVQAANPLEALIEMVQDFPKHSYDLAENWITEVSAELRQEIGRNAAEKIDAGRNLFWFNGLNIELADVDPFNLLERLRTERRMLQHFTEVGMVPSEVLTMLAHPEISKSHFKAPQTSMSAPSITALGDFFDASDRTEGGAVITYWNNLEKDKRYQRWSRDLRTLLQPMYPGQFPQIRRNLWNVILVVDLSKPEALKILVEAVDVYISRSLPFRVAMVPAISASADVDSLSETMAKVKWHLLDVLGRQRTLAFLTELSQIKALRLADVSTLYSKFLQTSTDSSESDTSSLQAFDEVLANSKYSDRLAQTRKYVTRLGVSINPHKPQLGDIFINGQHFSLSDLQRAIQTTLGPQLQLIQQMVYYGYIQNEQPNIATYFYDDPETHISRNALILVSEANPLRLVHTTELAALLGDEYAWTSFIGSEDASAVVSIWLLADLSTSAGKAIVEAAIETVEADKAARVCIIHTGSQSTRLSNLLQLNWEVTQEATSIDQIRQILADDKVVSHASGEFWPSAQKLKDVIGVDATDISIIINGRLLTFRSNEPFTKSSFDALIAYERRQRIDPVIAALSSTSIADLAPALYQKTLMHLGSRIEQVFLPDDTANLIAASNKRRSKDYLELNGKHCSFEMGDAETAIIQIGVILDPISEIAQKWAPILKALHDTGIVHIHIFLNPTSELKELPIKRFYRYNFPSQVSFDEQGNELVEGVKFEQMPESTLLTFALDAHQSWLAFPRQSIHDLDNIRLSDLSTSAREQGVSAVFQLENILLEGHARDVVTNAPPRGLQVILQDHASNYSTDTIVMANLGYLQLKANPGVWSFSIRPGKSSQIYHIDSLDGNNAQLKDGTVDAVLTTFRGVTIFPKVKTNKGMDARYLLEDEAEGKVEKLKHEASALFGKVKQAAQSVFSSSHEVAKTANKDAEINIFTVASGLLYERMAMIMILSVLKHTESSVKFWFINNFLSPSFKAFIPHLAKEYGFDYELVTYKWPHWLRGQKEKQRTIWGYKILFLDVLFPLELDRVIFVDSDQIVRTDLKQLIDLDLEGAPYAYTPMGDSRPDMDQYRFWKTGYWADHLRGLPYHISALYVIDLDRFRKLAAGDKLRGHYHAISADPNSLANLDQDLPNNMQHDLPIYTLDKSWLWCETWCSDESLAEAKTIDLCNNPKTHEPKLIRAKRLLPEWTVYDSEIAVLAKRVAEEQKTDETKADDSATAFAEEVGELEQAKLQQTEFVEEGTGSEHVKDEL